ncbi:MULTISPECIES: TonB-dependent receptor [Sphingobium]|jgi:iron complex outermembrane receptor protein|uniref:TonB-dependent receptor n=1 Tax=Sphingobium limneticum TaxID=1007511 RepID=A0A5J5HSC3_9SPHN|nr:MULTISPECIES: TonB-dependent receptor [Sphingobium]KAA9012031.1 TonB-dependent receptor [Sphingobium limneticum]KAA9024482.1 TonB-dependent receptor [Sphingobium limneticum]BBD02872.1 iron complex outermembrane recepter protein [Sphingobium sp. YG1]
MSILKGKRRFYLISTMLMGAAAPVGAGIAYAQEAADDTGLTEIVVTAERRAESSQKVPLAIQSISGETLAKTGYTSVTDLQYTMPGVQYDPTQGAAFQIRGVGSTSFDFSNAKSVSVVVDDVVMDGQRANGLTGLVDIERVDVLMGPQGTLFGKNATSGVIAVTTGKPKIGDTSAKASASFGEHEERILNGTVNIPLGPIAALRVSGFDQAFDGFGRNVTLNRKVGSQHEYGGRAKLYLEPSDSFNLMLSGDYAYHWDSSVRTPVSGQPAAVTAILKELGVFPGPESADTADSSFGQITTEEWGTSLRLNAKLGDLDLTSITAYRRTRYDNATPASLVPVDRYAYIPFNNGYLDTEKVSQEVHLASPTGGFVEWLVGGFYNDLRARQVQLQWGTLGTPLYTNGVPARTLFALTGAIGVNANASRFDAQNETMAAFGQLKFNISDRLSLTLGGRYTHDNNSQGLDFITVDPVPIAGYTPIFVGSSAAPAIDYGKVSGNNFSYRIAPQFQVTDNVMLYASYSTGYKPAGIAFVGNKYAPYRDETVKAWEAGIKSEWFGRRLRVNLDIFRSDFKDFQATILTKIPDGNGGLLDATVIGNAGGLRTQGVEGNVAVQPVRGLTLSGALSYTDAKFTDYVYNATTDYTGSRLTNSPKWSGTAAIDYETAFDSGFGVRAHADYAYRSEYWTVVGQPAYSNVPSYGLVNTRLTFALPSKKVEFGVYARNLFDTYFSTGWQNYGALGLLHYTSPNARRTVGGFVNVSF